MTSELPGCAKGSRSTRRTSSRHEALVARRLATVDEATPSSLRRAVREPASEGPANRCSAARCRGPMRPAVPDRSASRPGVVRRDHPLGPESAVPPGRRQGQGRHRRGQRFARTAGVVLGHPQGEMDHVAAAGRARDRGTPAGRFNSTGLARRAASRHPHRRPRRRPTTQPVTTRRAERDAHPAADRRHLPCRPAPGSSAPAAPVPVRRRPRPPAISRRGGWTGPASCPPRRRACGRGSAAGRQDGTSGRASRRGTRRRGPGPWRSESGRRRATS